MKPVKRDLRVVKTLRSIDEAIVKLLHEKNFKDITVKDICDTALINRGTFYSHYKDKYELINSYQKSLIEGAENLLYTNLSGVHLDDPSQKKLRRAFEELAEYIQDNKDKILSVVLAYGKIEFMETFSKHMYKLYRTKQKDVGIQLSSDKLVDYLITYVSNAHIGIITKWLEGGCKETPAEMAELFELFTVKGIFKTVL